MTNLDKESLFSLELVVDQLHLHQSVECRIPAIAFRLLDFPTLLIHHVEPELSATIRSKLLGDRYWPVPSQLKELKDHKTGSFAIRRGKSCLFRVSPNAIVSSLSGAPLYIMVVDMFPETPKLVGSCGVPLNTCAGELYDDIVTHGVSVPAVRAEKCELDLCNLMGRKLGTILLGYRLLSLGAALLSHIPARNIINVKPKEALDDDVNLVAEVSQSASEACSGIVPHSVDAESRLESVEMEKISQTKYVDSQTQIDPCSYGSVGTQTSRQKSVRDRPKTLATSYAYDCSPTNMVCPPPLFYNSTTCKKTVCWEQEEWSSVWQMTDDASWSDAGTIRIEDRHLDFDEATAHKMQSYSHDLKAKHSSPLAIRNSTPISDPVLKESHPTGNMSQFPILSALMAEILRFGGRNLIADSSREDSDAPARYRIQHMTKLRKRDSVKPVEPRRTVHRCSNMVPPHERAKKVSKPRSPEPPVHQKPLLAGMTNTQRLRLARMNPRLLQELDAKEQQRKLEFRVARMNASRQKENVPTDRQRNVDKIETLEHLDNLVCDESRESTARYKCPVPTPRTSKMHLSSGPLAERITGNGNASGFGTKTFTVDRRKVEPQFSLQSSSEEKIEFTLPPVIDESDTGQRSPGQLVVKQTDAALARRQAAAYPKLNSGAEPETRPADNLGQTHSVSAPVMLGDTSTGSSQMEAANAGNLLTVEDLGLQKIVDHYSGDSDDENSYRTEAGSEDEESKSRNIEHSSGEYEEGSARNFSEDGEKAIEAEQLQQVVNQHSADISESEQYEYEDEFDDTPARSLKTISTVNSSASSVVHKKMAPGQETLPKLKTSGQSWAVSRMGENGRQNQAGPLTDRSTSVGGETYSDAFETISDDEMPEPRPAREARLLPSAQLGYTWA